MQNQKLLTIQLCVNYNMSTIATNEQKSDKGEVVNRKSSKWVKW